MGKTHSYNGAASETGARVNAVAEWRSPLLALTASLLLFETATGLAQYLLPFSPFTQLGVLLHTAVGVMMVVPVTWYVVRHWRVRRGGNLSHFQLLGYAALLVLVVCALSGFVLTYQSAVGPRISYTWDQIHLLTGVGFALLLVVHLVTVVLRRVNNPEARAALGSARRRCYAGSLLGGGLMICLCVVWAGLYTDPDPRQAFPDDYNWRFGEDRPFAPSLARLDQSDWIGALVDDLVDVTGQEGRDRFHEAIKQQTADTLGVFTLVKHTAELMNLDPQQHGRIDEILERAGRSMRDYGAMDSRALAGSEGCGTSGCHSEILQEWLPSAHRYSSLDDMFQRVQSLMAEETSPEHTRYCAGCHDPISLFSGAKDSGNVTLSAEGAHEGLSCLVCHSIVQADVQGNGDYTIRAPQRYVYEQSESRLGKLVSDFLIRAYPQHHITSYARSLYKTPEFCAACHKQYLDKEVNTDIGKVQGQNQYDSWKNSRWYHQGDPTKTVACRECHMPLVDSNDPARGDATDYNRTVADGKHRSHRMLASNQYIPILQDLPNAELHTRLTERWLRGEIEIPEIADKWTTGPVVRLDIVVPDQVYSGQTVPIQVILTNNKTGHDFPTGPLDMIESWVELIVTDGTDAIIYHAGAMDPAGRVADSPVIFKADGFDRQGELIDRHNLWDLVGASYKRTLYPGVTDTVQVEFQCPSMARGRVMPATEGETPGQRETEFSFTAPPDESTDELTVEAILWYRKANPEFLDRVYGADAGVRSPATEMTRVRATIRIASDAQASIH